MGKMKIDFLQIGFTRCGTNFLLENVYPYNPHLEWFNKTVSEREFWIDKRREVS